MEQPAPNLSLEEVRSEISLGRFYEEELERARRMAFRLLGGDAAAADDVVQDAFVKAYRKRSGFRGDAALRTWFYRILLNEAHNHRRWRALRRGLRILREELPDPGSSEVGDPAMRRRIAGAMERLSRKQREVIVLMYFEGFTARESAELMGMAEGTVKTHLHRALGSLREQLDDLRVESGR